MIKKVKGHSEGGLMLYFETSNTLNHPSIEKFKFNRVIFTGRTIF